MAVRSNRIYGPQSIPIAQTQLYTVAAGRTLIIRRLSVVNTHATIAYSFQLWWPSNAANAEQYPGVVVQPRSRYVDDGWQALRPGDVIWGQASVASALRITIYGALLLGAPV